MMKRNNNPVKMLWIILDVKHRLYEVALEAFKVQHEGRGAHKLSVNVREDGTQALVKVSGVTRRSVLRSAFADAVREMYDESDKDVMQSKTFTSVWSPVIKVETTRSQPGIKRP